MLTIRSAAVASLVALFTPLALAQPACEPVSTVEGVKGVAGGTDGGVFDLELFDLDGAGPGAAEVLVAGDFTIAGGEVVPGLASWDGRRWAGRGEGLPTTLRGALSLALHEGSLYASVLFDNSGPAEPRRLARRDGSTWTLLDVPIVGSVSQLTSVTQGLAWVDGGSVRLWDGAQVVTIATFSGGANRRVLLAAGDGVLYAGGTFSSMNGQTATSKVYRWDGSAWQAVGGLSSQVTSLAWFDGAMHAGGTFYSLAGGTAGLARFVSGAWERVGPVGNSAVKSLHVVGDRLWAAGALVGGPEAYQFSRLSPEGEFDERYLLNVSTGGGLPAVLDWQGGLVLSGPFTTVRAALNPNAFIQTSGVAKIDAGGSITGLSTIPRVLGVTPPEAWYGLRVHRMREIGSGVFAVGSFSNGLGADGVADAGIARFDGTQWEPFGRGLRSFSSGLPDVPIVADVALHNGEAHVTGFFEVGSTLNANLARWNGGGWEAVSIGVGAWDARFGRALASFGDRLILGGRFSRLENVNASNVAAWNGQTWEPMGLGLPSAVDDLIVFEDRLYASGEVDAIGTTRRGIARWNGTAWESLGLGLQTASFPLPSNTPTASRMQVHDGFLYVFGFFSSAGEVANTRYFARWDGDAWSALNLAGAPMPQSWWPERTDFASHAGDLIILGQEWSHTGAGTPVAYRYNDEAGWRQIEEFERAPGLIQCAAVRAVGATQSAIFFGGNLCLDESAIRLAPYLQQLDYPCGACDSVDFNNDSSLFDPTDVDAFFSVFSEGPCIPADATCNDVDFNNDGSTFDPQDIDSFLSVFSEGPCL